VQLELNPQQAYAVTGKLPVTIRQGESDVRSRPAVYTPHEGEAGGHDCVSAPQKVLVIEMDK
jgi:hypothetical protein